LIGKNGDEKEHASTPIVTNHQFDDGTGKIHQCGLAEISVPDSGCLNKPATLNRVPGYTATNCKTLFGETANEDRSRFMGVKKTGKGRRKLGRRKRRMRARIRHRKG
jgi:hypothetical protein